MVTGLEELVIVGTVGPGNCSEKNAIFFGNFQVIFMNTAHIQFFTGNIL